MKELNNIDQLRQQIVLEAERRCRKLKTCQVPFAPDDVQLYGRQIRLWSLVIAKKAKRKVSTRLISRLAKKLHLKNYMTLTIEAIQKLRASAWKNYRSVKPTAREHRQRFLEKRIEAKELEGDV